MGEFSLFHWLIFFGIVMLLFGNRMPQLAPRLARALSSSRRVSKNLRTTRQTIKTGIVDLRLARLVKDTRYRDFRSGAELNMGLFNPEHMLIFGVIAILLFGSRLPTVARSLGKSLGEFKKGMGDLEQDFKSSIYSEPKQRVTYSNSNEQTEQPAGPKFEPPKA